MTADDRFDQDLVAWLRATAPASAPATLHGDAISRAGTRRQRPGWLVTASGAMVGPAARRTGWLPRTAVALGIIALLTLAALAAVLLVTHRPPSRLGGNGAIVFSWQGNNHGPGGIEFIDTAGNRLKTKASRCATFSDDGRYLIYSQGDAKGRLVLDPMDGSPVTNVPMAFVYHGIEFRSYELSPDATRVAHLTPGRQVESAPDADGSTSGIEVDNEMWVSPVTGGGGIRVASAPESGLETYFQPTWSPDGSQVAFLAWGWDFVDNMFVARGGTIVIAQADGSGVRRLETGRAALGDVVAWSPDGKRLAYIGVPEGPFVENGPRDVFVINVDGTGRTNITTSPTNESEQAWAPDGSAIAFLVDDDVTQKVGLVPMTGGSPSGPAVTGPDTGLFTWSPDGRQILFVDGRTEPPPSDGASPKGFSFLRTIDRGFVGAPSDGFAEVSGMVLCHLAWQRLP